MVSVPDPRLRPRRSAGDFAARDLLAVIQRYRRQLQPLEVVLPARPQEKCAFYPADLERIFASPMYRGCASASSRSKPGDKVIRDASYWLPILGLFTGARLQELGQVLRSDVKDEDGITYLDIRAGDGKSLKTGSSKRRVPTHPELVRVGFLAFVKDQRGPGLFPELRSDIHGKLTGCWAKWYRRYSTAIGITDPRKVFHSFRHTFKDACRRAGISEEVHDALTGHSNGSVGRSYGLGVPLSVLAEAVVKVRYPVLNVADQRRE